MAKRAAARDTITFKKTELINKIKDFLDENDACDGDWLKKAKVYFLGEKESSVFAEVLVKATCRLNVLADEPLTRQNIRDAINKQMEDGEFSGFDYDDEDFVVEKISIE